MNDKSKSITPQYTLSARTIWLCRILKWLTVVLAVLGAVMFFTQDIPAKTLDFYWNELDPDIRELVSYSDGKKILLKVLATLSYFTPALVLIGAFRVLSVFQSGSVFTLTAVKAIRFFGLAFLIHVAVRIVINPAMFLALTYDNPPGNTVLSISLSTKHIFPLLIGAIFMLIGHVFTEAVRQSDENRQFI
jgi:hypothetical protein